MNMHAKPQRTHAETALIDGFVERFSDLPGNEAVIRRRDDAVERLKAGLPTRRVEAWHYTDLRRLLATVPAYDPTASARPLPALLQGSTVLPVLNGVAAHAPRIEGVSVVGLEQKLADGSIAPAMTSRDAADVIAPLNAAFVTDGWFLDIADGAAVDGPIELQNVQAGGQVHVRFPVRVGAGARATIVERQSGSGDALVSSVSHMTVGEGADITWVILQEQPVGATHFGQFNAVLAKDAKLTLFVMNTGGKLVRQEIKVDAKGEGAVFNLRGVNLLNGDSHTDVTMVLDHSAPNTTSSEIIRNVVTGRARGVFQGQIRVDRLAQKTDAKMACNTLLLSDEGEFSAKPELEIFADDVACGHGATVTEIDRSHLFYLMARGVPEKQARGLLVRAFVAEVIEGLEDEALVAALEAKLEAWFARNG
ncbi:Fe-S cluster assembly protein SufD [Aquibium sp. ELW1220]|uniref:Fe-S cluster assembly protein SufD n=1 Tax=Aquibium sp. ELW1220 TaxID=2976766 RepID=UPI0025B279CE|nr:Fe-S cluster assembly protein SufD [Aquibium sp. ELW1220]MDN2579205.1 Fe-S cluster assembly protein SufD [Aquibium sp. ELW1220]